ncbi:MAG: histidine phosphatase family protein [bacterium]|nr:histidine phosphatase family protein [bacterium]
MPPLNEEGVSQAKEAAEKLKEVNFDLVVSSDLIRAKHTAEIINNLFSKPLEIFSNFRERDFGSLGGKTWEEIGRETGLGSEGVRKEDLEQRYNYRLFGGESAEDVKNRLEQGLSLLKKKHADKRILLVAHGGIIRLMHHLHTEEPDEDHKMPKNASLHYFSL